RCTRRSLSPCPNLNLIHYTKQPALKFRVKWWLFFLFTLYPCLHFVYSPFWQMDALIILPNWLGQ
ncbi:hypothetical protein QG142_01125, partial [Kingella kingae]|nr:hypothetical protein [Kingella kingae]